MLTQELTSRSLGLAQVRQFVADRAQDAHDESQALQKLLSANFAVGQVSTHVFPSRLNEPEQERQLEAEPPQVVHKASQAIEERRRKSGSVFILVIYHCKESRHSKSLYHSPRRKCRPLGMCRWDRLCKYRLEESMSGRLDHSQCSFRRSQMCHRDRRSNMIRF